MVKKVLFLLSLLIVLMVASCSVNNDDLVNPDSAPNPKDSIAKAD